MARLFGTVRGFFEQVQAIGNKFRFFGTVQGVPEHSQSFPEHLRDFLEHRRDFWEQPPVLSGGKTAQPLRRRYRMGHTG